MGDDHPPAHPALRPLIHRGYIGYREDAGGPLRRLEVPHQAITVVVNLGPPIAVSGWAGRGSFVAGLHDRAVVTEHPGELSRAVVELAAVLPGELTERLADAPDWRARFALLDMVLLGRWTGPRRRGPTWPSRGRGCGRRTARSASRSCAPTWAAAGAISRGASRTTSGWRRRRSRGSCASSGC